MTCTLRPSPAASSSDLLARQILDEFARHEVTGDTVRAVDYDLHPGVESEMGDGDQWPLLRDRILECDILVFSTPTWLGHMSSVAQRVLERLDAELSDTDSADRPRMVGKVAVVAVVGNEDGAHKIVADAFQALNDIGFTIPAQGCTYWNGEAMSGVDYQDLEAVPEAVARTTTAAVRNATHLCRLLSTDQYPPYT